MIRFDGASGYAYDGHRGTDFAVPSNTPVLAADDGTVIYSEWSDSGGWGVVIDHAYDRTGDVQGRRCRVRTGDDEGLRERSLGDEVVDPPLQSGHHLRGHQRDAGLELLPLLRIACQVGADHEQLPLQGEQVTGERLVIAERPGQAQHRDGLIGRAVRLRDQVGLGNAAPVQEPGGAVVSRLRVDARHRRLA